MCPAASPPRSGSGRGRAAAAAGLCCRHFRCMHHVWLIRSLLPWTSSRWQATGAIRHAAYSCYRASAAAGRRGHGWGGRAHHDLGWVGRTASFCTPLVLAFTAVSLFVLVFVLGVPPWLNLGLIAFGRSSSSQERRALAPPHTHSPSCFAIHRRRCYCCCYCRRCYFRLC